MKKRLIIALAFLVLFSTYKSKKLTINSKLNIEEIKIENNFILKSENIKKKLNFLYNENLIFLDLINLEEKLKKIDFVESFEIKKIYPKKLKIKIYEKKPIVILQYKKKKFYISDNIEIIRFIELEYYKDLPVVFGDQENFKILYMNLKKIDFPLDLISKYYLYKSKRWDLETNKKVIIKLPPKNYITSLKSFMNLRNEISFDKYKIFDYRINDQLILK
jgi:cell division septal protein FtsQ